jgi:hypothetical protein
MSQAKQILNYLSCGKTITTFEAFEKFQITRLPDRIRDLREDGHTIFAERVRTPSGKFVCQYSL